MRMIREVARRAGEQAALVMWERVIRVAGLYGCEVFVWKRGDCRRADAMERDVLRAILGVERGANNELVYGETGIVPWSVVALSRAKRYWEAGTEELEEETNRVSEADSKAKFELLEAVEDTERFTKTETLWVVALGETEDVCKLEESLAGCA
eukprot:Pompholyxophrys_punicea_v1_NODE_383_length_2086_cov_4.626292.p2 type:complete len:153 gc:universal NODE_383_length_2086_cov_4.626292:1613-1155(-)